MLKILFFERAVCQAPRTIAIRILKMTKLTVSPFLQKVERVYRDYRDYGVEELHGSPSLPFCRLEDGQPQEMILCSYAAAPAAS
jgi:hypothetical protein